MHEPHRYESNLFEGEVIDTRPIERFGDIGAHPILGGLHHRYARI